MGTYRKVFNEVRLTSYDDVRKTIDNVEQISTLFKVNQKRYHFHFSFGDNECTTESITDFVETAYGRSDFRLISMQMMYFLPENQHFAINYLCGIQISATSNTLLEKIVNLINLEINQIDRKNNGYLQTSASTSTTSSGNVLPTNTTVVQGNGNYIVTGDGSINYTVAKNESQSPKTKKSFVNHPLFIGIVSAVVAGMILMFSFWEKIVSWIENLFM